MKALFIGVASFFLSSVAIANSNNFVQQFTASCDLASMPSEALEDVTDEMKRLVQRGYKLVSVVKLDGAGSYAANTCSYTFIRQN